MVPYRYRTVSYRAVSYYERFGTVWVQYCIAVLRIPPNPCSNPCHIGKWRVIYSTTIYHVYNIVTLETFSTKWRTKITSIPIKTIDASYSTVPHNTFKISNAYARFIHGLCPAYFWPPCMHGLGPEYARSLLLVRASIPGRIWEILPGTDARKYVSQKDLNHIVQ